MPRSVGQWYARDVPGWRALLVAFGYIQAASSCCTLPIRVSFNTVRIALPVQKPRSKPLSSCQHASQAWSVNRHPRHAPRSSPAADTRLARPWSVDPDFKAIRSRDLWILLFPALRGRAWVDGARIGCLSISMAIWNEVRGGVQR